MSAVVLLLLLSRLLTAATQTPMPSPSQTRDPAPAQTSPQADAQLSPQAAYDQAIRPLEITRRSPQNWSEVELSALKVAREQAKTACAARNPDQLNGPDPLALAHLCAFAQLWQPVLRAASRYVAAALAVPPTEDTQAIVDLAKAFDYKVQACLNLEKPDDALLTAQTMLRAVPYDEFASEATNSTAHYLHFIRTDQALALLSQRQPILLSLIKAQGAAGAAAEASLHPPLPLHALYADAIALPDTQQFAGQPSAAAQSYTELEASLPASLSSEDGMFIAERRRQYLLLGTHLPVLNPMASLLSPGAPAPQNFNTRPAPAKIFLLFPDWCNQCVVMGFNSAAKAKDLFDDYHVLFYPLIAQANPPERPAKAALKHVPLPPLKAGEAAQPERLHLDQQLAIKSTPDALLVNTPTMAVPNETLDAFAATDFPLIIAADHDGIIRTMQLAPEDALAPGGDIDQIVQHIMATWPPD